MPTYRPVVLLDDLRFPEGGRWRDGKLWFSDMLGHRILTVDADGRHEVVAEVPDDLPSGLGWLVDGTLIVAVMRTRKLLRVDDGVVRLHVDLGHLPGTWINDMVVDGRGRAYVGARQPREMALSAMDGRTSDLRDAIALVEPDGTTRLVTEELVSPNGCALSADGRTLVVVETRGHRLRAFDVADDGSLSNLRPFADVDPLVPDGMCLDAEGAAWVGGGVVGQFVRVTPDGTVTDRIVLPDGKWAVECELGGEDGRTLFLMTATCTLEAIGQTLAGEREDTSYASGWIETVRVDVPGFVGPDRVVR